MKAEMSKLEQNNEQQKFANKNLNLEREEFENMKTEMSRLEQDNKQLRIDHQNLTLEREEFENMKAEMSKLEQDNKQLRVSNQNFTSRDQDKKKNTTESLTGEDKWKENIELCNEIRRKTISIERKKVFLYNLLKFASFKKVFSRLQSFLILIIF